MLTKRKLSLLLFLDFRDSERNRVHASHKPSEVLSMPVFSVGPDPVHMLQMG